MKIDLDHIERVARAARKRVPGRWYAGNAPDECRDSVYADEDGTPIVEVADMLDRLIAEHIATCSPDVVLALVERVRAAEERVFQLEWKMKTPARVRETVTLSLVTLAPDSYYERKGRERCTYPGCRMPAQEEHCQCKRHAEGHAERNKKHMRICRRYERVQLGLGL